MPGDVVALNLRGVHRGSG